MSTQKIPLSQILDAFADTGTRRIVPKDFRDMIASTYGNMPVGNFTESTPLGIDHVMVVMDCTANDSYALLPPSGGVVYEDIVTTGKFYFVYNKGESPVFIRTEAGNFFQDGSTEFSLPQSACVMVVDIGSMWILVPIVGVDGLDGSVVENPHGSVEFPLNSTGLIKLFDTSESIGVTAVLTIESNGRVNIYEVTAFSTAVDSGITASQTYGNEIIDDIDFDYEIDADGFFCLKAVLGDTGTINNKITYRVISTLKG